ncbi:hypothetical protein [Cellulomonas sp. C5510]|uniref:hypothetical protein n=1 Tax=Cellulomonas sp. C5510 TaxID=2871170 RepID=UPI001C97409C|nr:hypothetical protein [Cellulomonas sp. C5510]QZN84991.1 hypothetical protein K5O09_14460 [Cellulomonas sp. C5510]
MTSIDETLARLRRAADSTAATLAAVRAAAPEETTATDDSGAVAVAVDRRGRPVGVRVADDWNRRTTPEELGRAVLAAAGAASADLGRAMSEALRGGAARASDALPVEPVAVPVFEGTPRPLADLAELAVAQLDGAATAQPATPATATGSAGAHVAVTLADAGLVGCDVDGRWAATQSGVALSTAVNQALGEAARALAALDQRRQEQDTVLAEAFAHLRALAPAPADGEARA